MLQEYSAPTSCPLMQQLGYERKEREFEKASDPLSHDYNFFEGHSKLQEALLATEDRLDYVEKRRKQSGGKCKMCYLPANRERLRELKLMEQLNVRWPKETRWRRKYMEVTGDEFVDRPASA